MNPPQSSNPVFVALDTTDLDYARQLAEQYNSSYDGFGSRSRGDPPLPRRQTADSLNANDMYGDKPHSFMDGEHL